MEAILLMAPPSQDGGGGLGGAFLSILPLLLVVLIFYVLVLRPHNKRQRETANMIAALKQGDRVLTSGGIYGTVVRVKEGENIAVLKISDQVKVEIAKSAIASVVKKSREA